MSLTISGSGELSGSGQFDLGEPAPRPGPEVTTTVLSGSGSISGPAQLARIYDGPPPVPQGYIVIRTNSGARNLAASADGITWESRDLPTGGTWTGIAYGAGRFVLVAQDSRTALTSTDGENWDSVDLGSAQMWSFAGYFGEKFVVLSRGRVFSSSSDGRTWQVTELPQSLSRTWVRAAYHSGTWIAVAEGSGTTLSSTDGVAWTQSGDLPSGGNQGWRDIAWVGTRFIAVPNTGKTLAYSLDLGTTWVSGPTLPTGGSVKCVAYSGTRAVILSLSSDVMTSTNGGVTWTKESSTVPITQREYVYWSNDQFLSISQAVNKILTSPDGITWTERTLPSSHAWAALAYGTGI